MLFQWFGGVFKTNENNIALEPNKPVLEDGVGGTFNSYHPAPTFHIFLTVDYS
jgi:hypothetical protein